MNPSPLLRSQLVVFTLALLSFGCLLGQFYGWWTMHWFGCWVLPPATVCLILIAYRHRARRTGAMSSPYTWIVYGTIGGLLAAIAYDLYRLPFVLAGAPLFKVFLTASADLVFGLALGLFCQRRLAS